MAKKRPAKRRVKRPAQKPANRREASHLRSNRDVVIFDHPTQTGIFLAEPSRVLLVRGEGPHKVRFWNQTNGSNINLTFTPRLGGKITIPLNHGENDEANVGFGHPRGRVTYTILLLASVHKKEKEKEDEEEEPCAVNAAADPQIIIE